MQLEWSRLAQADRDAIFDYLEAEIPHAAITVDDRIRTQTEALTKFPERAVLGESRERGSWSSFARPTSQPIASLAAPCGFCACCTVPDGGPRICPKNRTELWPGNHSSEISSGPNLRLREMWTQVSAPKTGANLGHIGCRRLSTDFVLGGCAGGRIGVQRIFLRLAQAQRAV
jgi:plasmid stabilization system protein ParE